MAWHLYRLGRAAFRRRWIVLGIWLAAVVAAGVGAATLSGDTQDEFEIPGIESMQAFDLIKDRTPEASPDGATAQIVYQTPEGSTLTDPDVQQAVQKSLAELDTESVASITSPYDSQTISENGRVGVADIRYDGNALQLTHDDISALEDAPDDVGADLRVEVGGDALQEMPGGGEEVIGVVIALFVLVITFGSLIAAGMPLVTALLGVGIGVAGITTATGFMDLGSSTPTLATMLGLAVGIDYALFITSRFRHEIHIGRDPEEAAGRAVGTAGSAVVFAGLTVVVALTGLSIVNIRFLTEMGIAAAITVGVSVLIALTLLPALFGFAKHRILGGKIPFLKARDPEDTSGGRTMGRRWADLITHHKAWTFAVGLIVAAAVAFPMTDMKLALPDNGSQPEDSSARQAYDLIADNFGAGTNGPLLVVVDTKNADDPEAAVAATTKALQADDKDVAAVVPAEPAPPQSDDPAAQQAYQKQLKAYQGQLQQAQYATVTVVPDSGPADAETQQLVHDIRDRVQQVEDETGARVLVSGQTALGIDVSDSLNDAFPKYLLVVVGLAFILLTVVFRSLLVPLKAMLGFLVSVVVALGATVAVFQWGWLADVIGVDNPGPILSMLPLLLVGILFGLAMDYELFLVSRMREEYVHGKPAKESVVRGFQFGARVVAAAAAIMIGVFGGFALGDDAIIKSMGFGLAVGILADAFLVRMTLVPAFMAIAGERMWWLPKWLSRIIPNVDIEGESLRRRLEEESTDDRDPARVTT
ncbi:MMPL family transporter [Solicola gregarius]|uniref:MMPL family transporter n=1 Tax=Solicola gregarius TaxID=2908642 RepID=A0AA46TLA4_9ACTN|nr:MMPL family transporter [Solicola gregarius]UYM07218.1 MMPL family transporter [Solicola gregarius]